MPVGDNTVLIGMSERASRQASVANAGTADEAADAAALEPGVVFTYDRNRQTNAVLRTPAPRSSRL